LDRESLRQLSRNFRPYPLSYPEIDEFYYPGRKFEASQEGGVLDYDTETVKIIHGEEGVGKTTFLRKILTDLKTRGPIVEIDISDTNLSLEVLLDIILKKMIDEIQRSSNWRNEEYIGLKLGDIRVLLEGGEIKKKRISKGVKGVSTRTEVGAVVKMGGHLKKENFWGEETSVTVKGISPNTKRELLGLLFEVLIKHEEKTIAIGVDNIKYESKEHARKVGDFINKYDKLIGEWGAINLDSDEKKRIYSFFVMDSPVFHEIRESLYTGINLGRAEEIKGLTFESAIGVLKKRLRLGDRVFKIDDVFENEEVIRHLFRKCGGFDGERVNTREFIQAIRAVIERTIQSNQQVVTEETVEAFNGRS
jgi:hypothetical protein